MQLHIDSILESPEFYPLKFEGPNLVFVRMSQETYKDSSFTLPSRIISKGKETWSIPFSAINALVSEDTSQSQTPAFLFQIAHCGSTLLSKALDHDDATLVIREPYALRQFAAAPKGLDEATIMARQQALSVLMRLYSRKFTNGQRVIIKGNVPVNFMFDELLKYQASLNAICLHSDLDSYIIAALKSPERQQWAAHVVRELELKIRASLDNQRLNTMNFSLLNPAQSAALLWFSQVGNFTKLASTNEQIELLESEHFFTTPFDTLVHCSRLLGLTENSRALKLTTESTLFSRHAKEPSQAYDNTQRTSDQDKALQRYADDLYAVRKWCLDMSLTKQGALGIKV